MTRTYVALAAGLLLAACGSQTPPESSTDQSAVNQQMADDAAKAAAEAEQKLIQQRQQDCIRSASAKLVFPAGSSVDERVVQLNSATFDGCPSEFVAAYVDYRTTFARAVDKAHEVDHHAAGESDAMGAGVGVTLMEGLTGANTGQTPYRDWSEGNQKLNSEFHDLMEAVGTSLQNLEVVAAKYGVTYSHTNNTGDETGNSSATPSS